MSSEEVAKEKSRVTVDRLMCLGLGDQNAPNRG